jgi:hypothetical protein
MLTGEEALVTNPAGAQHLAVSPAKQLQGFAIVAVEYLGDDGLDAAQHRALRRDGARERIVRFLSLDSHVMPPSK